MRTSAPSPIELANLAVAFRVNSPNLGHCTVYDTIYASTPQIAYQYGAFRYMPKRHTKQLARQRELIASMLDNLAAEIALSRE